MKKTSRKRSASTGVAAQPSGSGVRRSYVAWAWELRWPKPKRGEDNGNRTGRTLTRLYVCAPHETRQEIEHLFGKPRRLRRVRVTIIPNTKVCHGQSPLA